MTERPLQVALAALVLLHVVASWWWPGQLWGVSQMADWPRAATLAWSALALAALAGLPRWARRAPSLAALPFPNHRVAWLLAFVAGVGFWIGRETSHFFGDGALILRGGGLVGGSFWRAPGLVRPIYAVVGAARRDFEWSPDTTIAALAAFCGALAIYLALRLCVALATSSAERYVLAALLATSGALALFCGHIEYYAPLGPALLAFLWLVARGVTGRGPLWPAWFAGSLLVVLHLSNLALVPGLLVLGWRGWRRGERGRQVAAALGAVALAAALLHLVGSSGGAVAKQSSLGLHRYLQPYFDPRDMRHAYGFFSATHGLAVLNALLLVAPVAVALAPWLALKRPARRADGAVAFLAATAAGGLVLHVLFNPELGAYRDWDILAVYGFVYLAWAGVALGAGRGEPAPRSVPVAAMLILVAGLHHLVPWLALQARPGSAEAHLRRVLSAGALGSRQARGLLSEEFAIACRQRGDDAGALADYAAAAAAVPSDARYQLGLGDTYARLGDGAQAEQHFETALRLRPNYAPAHNNLALLLAKADRDLERACEHARTAVQLDPGQFNYVMTWGFAALRRGDLSTARQAFQRGASLQPDSPLVRRRLDELAAAAAARADSAATIAAPKAAAPRPAPVR